MPNGTFGGVRSRKTKVGRKLLRFPPTRLCISDLLGRLPLTADWGYDGPVLLELGESLVHLLAVDSGKGGHFTGRHRLACAAHSLENLCCRLHTY